MGKGVDGKMRVIVGGCLVGGKWWWVLRMVQVGVAVLKRGWLGVGKARCMWLGESRYVWVGVGVGAGGCRWMCVGWIGVWMSGCGWVWVGVLE